MSPFRAQEINQSLVGSSELRRNSRQCDVVSHGIATLRESGTMPAVEYLKSHGVRPQVIERVLLEPERRRVLAREDGRSPLVHKYDRRIISRA